MKKAKTVLIFVSGLLAVIPGFLVLKTSLGVPSEYLQNLFFAVLEASGCISILLIYSNKNNIITKTKDKKSKYALLLFCGFFIGIIIYLTLYNYCVIETPFSKGFLPLILSDELSKEIALAGGKTQFIEQWMTDGTMNIIQKTSSIQLTFTIIVFLIVYILTLVSLVTSFTIITLNIKDN
jgi:hypothetical protein